MKNYIQHQLEVSERLFTLMRDDHQKRMEDITHWAETCSSLIEKLRERDETILSLRIQLGQLPPEAKLEGED